MATLVRLTQEQIEYLFDQAEQIERELKDLGEELTTLGIPKETAVRFNRVHDRFTTAVTFIRRQRELGGDLPE
jgi:uncharacterized protein YydD (DUF2326 family)